ncbi:MAG: polyprenol monophosphomannose synthase [Dehalococcoidia bacterium]
MQANNSPVHIVVPTYNESENISILLDEIFGLDLNNIHVLIVDDNSPDNTADVAKFYAESNGFSVSILRRDRKSGLGTAYIEGFRQVILQLSQKEGFVVQMDADLSHDPKYILKMIEILNENDVAVGSRYYRGGGSNEEWGLYRKLLSECGNKLIRFVSGLKIKDCTSGFKVFRSQALKEICWNNIRCVGFGFQVEIAMQCQKNGFRIQEYPIIFNDRTAGDSKMSTAIIFEAILKITLARFSSFRLMRSFWGNS